MCARYRQITKKKKKRIEGRLLNDFIRNTKP